ncbi:DNA-directed RNA polymerase subunit beta, partial [Flavobacterium sp. IR1]
RLRPGEPPTVENAKSLLDSRFFDPKRYDLANVGRYKINKDLHITNRLCTQRLAETLVDPETGEVIAEEGTLLDRRTLDRILPNLENNIGFRTARASGGVVEDSEIDLQSIKVYAPDDQEGEQVIRIIGNGLVEREVKHITPADIIASINYFFNLLHGVGDTDDIDHLG